MMEYVREKEREWERLESTERMESTNQRDRWEKNRWRCTIRCPSLSVSLYFISINISLSLYIYISAFSPLSLSLSLSLFLSFVLHHHIKCATSLLPPPSLPLSRFYLPLKYHQWDRLIWSRLVSSRLLPLQVSPTCQLPYQSTPPSLLPYSRWHRVRQDRAN